MSRYRKAEVQKVPIQLCTVIKSVALTRFLSIEVAEFKKAADSRQTHQRNLIVNVNEAT